MGCRRRLTASCGNTGMITPNEALTRNCDTVSTKTSFLVAKSSVRLCGTRNGPCSTIKGSFGNFESTLALSGSSGCVSWDSCCASLVLLPSGCSGPRLPTPAARRRDDVAPTPRIPRTPLSGIPPRTVETTRRYPSTSRGLRVQKSSSLASPGRFCATRAVAGTQRAAVMSRIPLGHNRNV